MRGGDHLHRAAVSAWFERVAQGKSVESLILAFEETFAALWKRSQLTLGEVMLAAILDRALYIATERYPVLSSVEVGPSGLRCHALRSREALQLDDVAGGLRFVLVEFLTVLGNLTAQILTPALHAELSKGHP